MDETAHAPHHGGLSYDELAGHGLAPEQVLDVSVNVNPYGPCAVVVHAIRDASLERYPDPTGAPAKAAIGAWLDVPRDRIVVGNGAVDLLWSLARAFAGPGKSALIVEPAFSELRRAVASAGGRALDLPTASAAGFALDACAFDEALGCARPALAYVCTPSNPSGVQTPIELVMDVAARHPDTLLIVDLSFDALSSRPRRAPLPRSPNVIWLRSLTKDLALAGLRVGFAVAPPRVVTAVEAGRPPWSVNALAQAAAVAATGRAANDFVEESRVRLLDDRRRLDDGLRRLGLRPYPSDTIFSLVALPPGVAATALRTALLARHAVLVRDGTSFGLPHHVRLCARPERERARLLAALSKELPQ